MKYLNKLKYPAALIFSGIFLFACDSNPDGPNNLVKSKDSDSELDSDEGDTEIPEEFLKCAFGTGEYRNYFWEIGYSEDAIEAKLETAWNSLFKGNAENETVYYEAGENEDGILAYIMDVANNDVRSEGMSYGMMIAVQMDKKEEFDALWNWSKTFMWHGDESHPFYEYFAWSLDTEGNSFDDAPAPDGEEYFAAALYFAAGRWGNGKGIYDYKAQADRLVSAMKNRESIYGEFMDRGSSASDSGAAIFNSKHKMVRFSPRAGYFASAQGDHTDPSYHLPAFYQLWSFFGPKEDKKFWAEAADISRDFFQAAAHPETALTPDYANFDGTPVAASWNADTASFGPDARRTVMNWSMDWAWFCTDERERELSDKLQEFFSSLEQPYSANYQLDGTPLSNNYYSPSVVAMNAVSVLSATDEHLSADFTQALWDLQIPNGRYRYYDGMLYMMAILHVSGNFRVYSP